ncbi:MAG: UDP-N-acetylmuramate dehydrogenase [Candidatus Levybacteria bacterium]|nr:UDP-N-acetylmuramate dehydrogenase [Candidatus Levybacteria bacterium]
MKVLENVDLSTIAFYKIGGTTRFLLEVNNAADIKDAFRFVHEHSEFPVRVLSLGANLLIPDQPFTGITLWLNGDGSSFEVYEDSITSFAGEAFNSLIKFSFDNELIGLEWAGGLPSSVGGAVRGNAGCFGSEIKDTVLLVKAVNMSDPEMQVKEYSHEECEFGYRDSFFKHHPDSVIVSVTFQLKKATPDEIVKAQEVYDANILYRKKNHPLEYPSCGSVFKNIVDTAHVQKIIAVWPDIREQSETKWHGKIAVGYVINRLGFAGKRIGGAQVSEKHANYISNVDHARAEDVKELIHEISNSFEKTFGFVPEPEVVIE